MVNAARKTASNLLEAWSRYKLKEWMSMAIGGIIFVVGYVLGTLNWRRGDSRIFVILDILLGTVGFFYFCYKGLQIFAEAHDEIMTMIYANQSTIEGGETNHAAENDYVLRQTILDHIQGPKIQNEKSFIDDPAHENTSYCEFYPYRGSTLALEQHTSRGLGEEANGVHASRSSTHVNHLKPTHADDVSRCTRASQDPLYSSIRGSVQSLGANDNSLPDIYANYQVPRSLDLRGFSKERTATLVRPTSCVQSPITDRNRLSGIYANYQVPRSLDFRAFDREESAAARIPMCNCRGVPNHAEDAVQAATGGHQRPIQESLSNHLGLKNACMQHYQVPRKLAIGSLLDSPDPGRHLKPPSLKRRPLPVEPPPEDGSYHAEGGGLFTRPGLEESPLPSCYRSSSTVIHGIRDADSEASRDQFSVLPTYWPEDNPSHAEQRIKLQRSPSYSCKENGREQSRNLERSTSYPRQESDVRSDEHLRKVERSPSYFRQENVARSGEDMDLGPEMKQTHDAPGHGKAKSSEQEDNPVPSDTQQQHPVSQSNPSPEIVSNNEQEDPDQPTRIECVESRTSSDILVSDSSSEGPESGLMSEPARCPTPSYYCPGNDLNRMDDISTASRPGLQQSPVPSYPGSEQYFSERHGNFSSASCDSFESYPSSQDVGLACEPTTCPSPSYNRLGDDSFDIEDGSSGPRPGLQPSPMASQSGDNHGHSERSQDPCSIDKSFLSPSHRPPLVETPQPNFQQPPDPSNFQQRSDLSNFQQRSDLSNFQQRSDMSNFPSRSNPLQHRLSLPISCHQFMAPGQSYSQSSSAYFPADSSRGLAPLTKYMSHPLTVNSRPPSRYARFVRKSSSSSSSASSPSQSPLPRKRPSPPPRGTPNTPQEHCGKRPPEIPRKMRAHL